MVLIVTHAGVISSLQKRIVGISLQQSNSNMLNILWSFLYCLDGEGWNCVVKNVSSLHRLHPLQSLAVHVPTEHFANEYDLEVSHLLQVRGVADIGMVQEVILRKDSNLQVWFIFYQHFTYGRSDFASRTNVEELVQVRDVGDLVIDGSDCHSIACPHSNILVFQVGIFLDQSLDLEAAIIELFHLVQVTEAKFSRSRLLVLLFHQLNDLLVDCVVRLGADIIPRRSDEADDSANVFVGNAVARAVVETHKEPSHMAKNVHDEKLELEWQSGRFVRVIDIVKADLGDGHEMPKASVVPDEDKVLLVIGEQLNILLPVGTSGSTKVIPNRHKETVIGVEISMVPQMELWRVEKVPEGRILVMPDPVTPLQMSVSVGIKGIKEYQISTDRNPVLLSKDQKWSKESGSKGGNVDKVLFEVLNQTSSGHGNDR